MKTKIIQEKLGLIWPSKRILLETVFLTPIFTAWGSLFLSFTSLTGALTASITLNFVLYCILVAPISEEIVFRSIGWAILEKYTPLWMTVYITASIFLALHLSIQSFIGLIPLVGWLSYLRIRTKSVIPCIAAHMTNNMLAIVSMWIALL